MKMKECFKHRRTTFLSVCLFLAFSNYFGNSTDEGLLKRCCSDVNDTECRDSCNSYLERMNGTDGCGKYFNRILKCNGGAAHREHCCQTSSISSKCLELCSNYDKWIVNLTFGCGKQRQAILLCFVETAVPHVPPTIRNTREIIPLRPNEPMRIDCDARGKPNMTRYWWKKNGGVLHDKNNRTLEFNPAGDGDEGYYKCYASNEHGTAFSDVTYLRKATTPIREPDPGAPVFNDIADGPYSVIVTEGCDATFSCNASADPVAKIEWFQNGSAVNAKNPPERFDFSNDNRTLTVRNVCRDCVDRKRKSDLTVIQCNASNQHGYAFRSGTLNVLKKTTVKAVITNSTDNVSAVVEPVEKYTNVSICCIAVSDAVVALGTKLTWHRKTGNGVCSPVPEKRAGNQTGVTAFDSTLFIRIEANDVEAWSRLGGEYVCVGQHRYSWDQQVVTVSPNAHVVLKLDSQKTVDRKGVIFVCSFTHEVSKSPVTFGKFRWYLEKEEILNPIHQSRDDTKASHGCSTCKSSLTFPSIPPRYFENRVRCVVEYKSKVDFSRSAEGILPCVLIPEVSIKSSAYDVQQGKNCTLTCTVTNFDQINATEVTYHWYEDGRIMPSDAKSASNSPIETLTWTASAEKKSPVVIGCRATTKHENSTIQNTTITVIKADDGFCDENEDSVHLITWPLTKVGGIAKRQCLNNATGDCSRNCSISKSSGKADWSDPDCSQCVNRKLTSILNEILNFEETIGNNNRSQVANVVRALSDFTNQTDAKGLEYGDLSGSVNAVAGLVRLQRKNEGQPPKEDEVKWAVKIISNLLEPANEKSWTSLTQNNGSAAATLMALGDSYGRGLTQIINGTGSGTPVKEENINVVLEAVSQKVDTFPQRFEFPSSKEGYWGESRSDQISLAVHRNDLVSGEDNSNLNVWSLYYNNINDFLPSKSNYILNSRVISLSVAELKQNQNGNDQTPLAEYVNVTLKHLLNVTEKHDFQCVYWKFDPDDVRKGSWESDGCTVVQRDDESNETQTVCRCNHLTNFAILMSRSPRDDDKVLNIISKIGCIISVAALALTIFIYAVTWQQVKSHQAAVLLNLCLALLIAYVIFLSGADKGSAGGKECKAIAVLLHYFFLAAFCLMLAEGVQLFIFVYFVFHVRQRRETAALIVAGWVLPMIIVAVSVGITKISGYGETKKMCWLEGDLLWAFAGPVFAITAINIVIIVAVLRKIVCTRVVSSKKDHDNSKIRKMAWSVAVLCPVLGIAWLFGVLSISHDSIVFQYVFTIANSFQGLFIFIFHGLYNNKKSNEKISSFVSEVLSRTPFKRRLDTTVTSTSSSSGARKASRGATKDATSSSSGQDKRSQVQDSFSDTAGGKEGNPYSYFTPTTSEPSGDASAQVHSQSTTTAL